MKSQQPMYKTNGRESSRLYRVIQNRRDVRPLTTESCWNRIRIDAAMEVTEDKYEIDALKHKWADHTERQRWLMSREQPEICSLSTLKREAQTRLRQQSTKEYSKVCQVRENFIKTQAELLSRQQSLQNRLAETSMQLENVQNKRQLLYNRT